MKRHACCVAMFWVTATAFAASPQSFDWPQWQGPSRDAVSKEQGLLKEWPKGGPPLAWGIKTLGGGYGAPSVAGGPGRDGARCFLTPIGPMPGPPPPWGMQKVLCKLRWLTSAP